MSVAAPEDRAFPETGLRPVVTWPFPCAQLESGLGWFRFSMNGAAPLRLRGPDQMDALARLVREICHTLATREGLHHGSELIGPHRLDYTADCGLSAASFAFGGESCGLPATIMRDIDAWLDFATGRNESPGAGDDLELLAPQTAGGLIRLHAAELKPVDAAYLRNLLHGAATQLDYADEAVSQKLTIGYGKTLSITYGSVARWTRLLLPNAGAGARLGASSCARLAIYIDNLLPRELRSGSRSGRGT